MELSGRGCCSLGGSPGRKTGGLSLLLEGAAIVLWPMEPSLGEVNMSSAPFVPIVGSLPGCGRRRANEGGACYSPL